MEILKLVFWWPNYLSPWFWLFLTVWAIAGWAFGKALERFAHPIHWMPLLWGFSLVEGIFTYTAHYAGYF